MDDIEEPETAAAPVCPTCGMVHAVGDCHGVTGEPVILPAGYTVRPEAKPRKPRKRRDDWRPRIPRSLRAELEPIIKQAIKEARHDS